MDMDAWQRRWWRRIPWALREPLHVLVAGAQRWIDVSGPALGASIAFYTVFALAPLLLITIAIAGAVFGAEAARGQIVSQIEGLVGPVAAQAIEAMIETAWREPGGATAAAVGVITLLVGASGAFVELRRTLNLIGHITPEPSAISAFVRARLTAFALLLGCGFLAIASLVLSAALAGFTAFLSARFAGLKLMAVLFDLGVSIAVLSVAFAALVHWLPDRPPSRSGVWISALSSAVLFSLGKYLIGLYLGRSSVASSYGAAGSFVVLMLWIYYSSQILLFGAAIGRASDERRAERRHQALSPRGADRARPPPGG
jgi:membrane protein